MIIILSVIVLNPTNEDFSKSIIECNKVPAICFINIVYSVMHNKLHNKLLCRSVHTQSN